jgi:hypothetical protein
MRTLLFIVAILCCGHLLSAQDEVVVVHISGKGSYFAPGKSSAQPVYPGMRMALGGKLRSQSGGSVKLLYKGQTVTYNDGKMRSLSELEQLAKGNVKPGFLSRFWNFLSGSMQQTQDEKQLEDHHRRYMEEVYAGVKGFANPSYDIRSGLMYGNKLGGGPVTFRWLGSSETEALRLVIRRRDGAPVYTALVRGKACTIDFSQLALDAGTAGTWQLWPAADTATQSRSAATEFMYDPAGVQNALASLLPDPDYQHAFPAEQLLMEAYVLEKAGFYYDAAQKHEAAAAAHPKNALLRDARAAFLARMDLLEEAKSAMRE